MNEEGISIPEPSVEYVLKMSPHLRDYLLFLLQAQPEGEAQCLFRSLENGEMAIYEPPKEQP
jgi:hypothetical protein